MNIETLVVGPLQSNCYVIYDEKSRESMVVDPGDEAARIERILDSKDLKLKYIVCTHGHFDHVGAVSVLKEQTNAKLVIHKADLEIYLGSRDHAAIWGFRITEPAKPDILAREGDELSIGEFRFRILATPGHSPGGICLYHEGILLSGDTVFAGSVGRTDLYGGNVEDLKKSFARILALPPETKIFPGHGPSTTVEDEREYNFFVHEL